MGGFFLALLSAALLILAHPPFRFLLLPFVALVPLGVALGSLDPGPRSGRTAGAIGLSFGVVFWGILLFWVPLVVAPQFPWAYPGYGVQIGLLSGLFALMAWATHRLHRGARLPLDLALPLAWVAMEWLKAHFPFGLSFPWLGLGISLTSWPELLGMAEWTGEGGVAFWLALVNGLLASWVLAFSRVDGSRKGSGFSWRSGLLALVTGLAPAALGLARARTLDLVPGPSVAVVGTNVPRTLRLRPEAASVEGLAQAEEHLRSLSPGFVDLVILPEATVAVPLDGPQGDPHREALTELARMAGSPLLVGALGVAGDAGVTSAVPSGPVVHPPLTNSAFLVGPDGSLSTRYDKVRLVPGMEWGGFVPGRPGVIHPVGRHTFGTLICYESLFGDLARELRASGAGILVNLSSDVWFGEGDGRLAAVFLYQHPAHLVMRAAETRMGVARAANGGLSFILDPVGRPVSETVSPDGGVAWAVIPVSEGLTVFTRTGDLVGPGAFLVVLIYLTFSALGRGSGSGWRVHPEPPDRDGRGATSPA